MNRIASLFLSPSVCLCNNLKIPPSQEQLLRKKKQTLRLSHRRHKKIATASRSTLRSAEKNSRQCYSTKKYTKSPPPIIQYNMYGWQDKKKKLAQKKSLFSFGSERVRLYSINSTNTQEATDRQIDRVGLPAPYVSLGCARSCLCSSWCDQKNTMTTVMLSVLRHRARQGGRDRAGRHKRRQERRWGEDLKHTKKTRQHSVTTREPCSIHNKS